VGTGRCASTENVSLRRRLLAQRDDNVATGFDGQPVDGAHNVSLNNTVQADHGDIDPHTGAGLYYISTVDPSGALALARGHPGSAGADPDRNETGYVFSRIVGGARSGGWHRRELRRRGRIATASMNPARSGRTSRS
jgi:hypothetical protein